MKTGKTSKIQAVLLTLTLMVAALGVFPAMVAAQEMVKDSLGRMVEKPQYGGVLNLVVDQPDGSFDPNTYYGAFFAMPVYEHLSAADWSRGPSGTGEFPMNSTYEPLEGRVGFVAESWEQPDLHTVIYHIRKGVHFQDKPPVNGREVTAHRVTAVSLSWAIPGIFWALLSICGLTLT